MTSPVSTFSLLLPSPFPLPLPPPTTVLASALAAATNASTLPATLLVWGPPQVESTIGSSAWPQSYFFLISGFFNLSSELCLLPPFRSLFLSLSSLLLTQLNPGGGP